MNNLNESIKYTLDKKTHQLTKLEKSFWLESHQDIEGFLQGKESDTSMSMGLEYLSTWYTWQFNHSFLTKNQVDNIQLAYATQYGIEANKVKYFIGEAFPTYGRAIQFTEAIKHCAQALIMGWDELAKNYLNLLIKMLYGKQYKGRVYESHAWFMLELLCQWAGITLDEERVQCTDGCGKYNLAMNEEPWDTKDSAHFAELMDELAEYHIRQSDEYERKYESDPEFTSADYFIFAIELVLILAIRRRMGLPEYEPSNDLMKLAINQLPNEIVPIPKIEIIEQCKAKIRADNPTIDFEI